MKPWLIGAAVCGALTASAFAGRAGPNIVVIITDDQGYADAGFQSPSRLATPNIDRIAREGVRFTQGYVTYSVCGPSRAGLMTGRYQDRFGSSRNPIIDPSVPNNGVPRTQPMISELLKPAGYKSAIIGKWHLGTHPTLRPNARGFDEFFGFTSGGHEYLPEKLTLNGLEDVREMWAWYRTKIEHNDSRVEITGYLTDELSDAAVRFIDRQGDEPFFLYLAYNAPHTPMQATEEYLARFPDEKSERRRVYAAMMSAVDDGVGRVLDKLDELQLADDTIVFFLSDNGGANNNASDNTPLKDGKGSFYEGGIRVPFAMRWTGTIPAGTVYDHPVIALDIAATAVAQAGVKVPEATPLDGVDLVPYVRGDQTGRPHQTLFWVNQDAKRYAIRDGDWKLILQTEPRALFNLADDPSETKDLAAAHPEVVERLQLMHDQWMTQMVPPATPSISDWKFD